ncbi:MAG TPA: substrate-binding domain-containing protein [Candidatus Hydrogenedentes bacterium]|nr:substrate-binding domain-containing protein [Candidatus Hydrogenedentota bacterium]HPG68158.1 substrate-binding domain-containing protein [Candidatus Hydrogenedentota bacterium]
MAGKCSELAAIIEQNIRSRGLHPGDRYLTAREAAEMLGVSPMTANRAMHELADRDVLVLKHGAGTFVGTKAPRYDGNRIECVNFVLHRPFFACAQSFLEHLMNGVHHRFPHNAIQYSFLPSVEPLNYCRLLEEAWKSGLSPSGVILFVGLIEVQRFFQQRRVPAVVCGSVCPEAGGLPWVDRDQRTVGRILTEYVVGQGHQRVMVLMREIWDYGDNLFMDGIQEALRCAQISQGAASIRSLPCESGVVADALQVTLSAPDAPTALICRSSVLADLAARAAEAVGLRVPNDVLIVMADYFAARGKRPRFPYARAAADARTQGEIIGRMLKELAAGKTPEPDHFLIPVELDIPADGL